jgi:predicted peptidase
MTSINSLFIVYRNFIDMKPLLFFAFSCLILANDHVIAQQSNNDKRLDNFLEQYPEADANKDGKLTRGEVDVYRKQMKSTKARGAKSKLKSPVKRHSFAEMAELYEALEFEGMPYRLMKPIDFKADEKKRYPLILSLHGAGGKGINNKKNLMVWNGVLAEEALRKKHPCFVISPQSPVGSRIPSSAPKLSKEAKADLPEVWRKVVTSGRAWLEDVPEGRLQTVFDLLDSLCKQYPIDLNRVYVVGHSMGGFGTFESIALQPDRFAAAIPSAGGMLPWHDLNKMTNLPIWAFHGDQDTTVPIGLTKVVFEQMKKLKGNMKLTKLGGVGHGSSGFAFIYSGDEMAKGFVTHNSSEKCDLTSDVWDWLFSQQRAKPKP